ncbi:MAG: P-loop NTPase fold protein [Microcystis sp. LE19-10.1B]|uniref:P-loop NTPase fold protein n=1 Tax=Microcystis sp. LE19-10.1B TaxID=3016428 RepID=UPI0022BAD332|nr:P-loop NTPase fold protein [Microcystis sp. LE19-10.1B]MCZ8026883.1 P-loop NTPase fold protein [Microcystis sp. LE19-10.1B]MCZ8365032.1 P-loop NTPase fold protein [Microcystis sp. LE19-251.1A]
MKRKALVIGVNQYKGSIFCPQHSLKDAEDIAQLLRTFGRFDEVQVLLNQFKEQDKDHKNPYEPDKLKILIEQLFNPQDGDTETALFYFSGNGAGIYGAEEKETQKGDLLLTDFPDPLTESQSEPTPKPKSRSISLTWLHDQLEKSPVKQQIVWLDSDFSNLFIDLFSQASSEVKYDRCFIAANYSYAGETSTHGVLTDALLQGLNSVKQIKNSITNHDLVDDLLKTFNWPKDLIKNIGYPIPIIESNLRGQKLLNDSEEGDDLLSIKNETNALADMLLLRDLKPPLAVGILGGWGSGKSFIMNLMQQRMNEIRSLSLTEEQAWSTEEKKAFPYVGHIYQIKFDAWTFAKYNLWASLMQTIFLELDRQISLEQKLARVLAEDSDNEPSRAKALRETGFYWSFLYETNEEDRAYFLDRVLPQQKLALLKDPPLSTADSILWKELLWEQYGKVEKQFQERKESQQAKLSLIEQQKSENQKQIDKIKDKIVQIETDYEGREKYLKSNVQQAIHSSLDIAKTILINRLGKAGETVFEIISSQIKEELEKQNIDTKQFDDVLTKVSQILESGKIQQDVDGKTRTINLTHKAFTQWFLKNSGLITGFVMLGLASVAIPIIVDKIPQVNIGAQIASLIIPLVPAIGVAQKLLISGQKWYIKVESVLTDYKEQLQEYKTKQPEKLLQERTENDPVLKSLSQQTQQFIRVKNNLEIYQIQLEQETLEIEQAIAETEAKLPQEQYGKLSSFVRSRIEDNSYEKHLGLMHQIKEDIWKLSISLLPPKSEAEFKTKLENLKKVFPRGSARVFIYIDDLDRCPPHRVVEVLEAVQLLVKTPLFIAVLAIDERYITRALEKYYKDVLIPRGSPSGIDYLEKIIQIPYRVRSIAHSALFNYLDKQMEVERKREENKATSKETSTNSSQGTEIGVTKTTNNDKSVSTQPDQIAKLTLDTLKFTETEFDELLKCCQQIELSPRKIKRLVNIYKIFRISEFHASKMGKKSDEQARVILSVLALSARYPDLIREVFEKLDLEFEKFETLKQGLKRFKELEEKNQTVQAEEIKSKEKELKDNEKKLKEMKILDFFSDLSLEPGDAYLQREYNRLNLDATALLEDVTLTQFDLETFNLVRSFRFFGDIGYSPEDSQRTVRSHQG